MSVFLDSLCIYKFFLYELFFNLYYRFFKIMLIFSIFLLMDHYVIFNDISIIQWHKYSSVQMYLNLFDLSFLGIRHLDYSSVSQSSVVNTCVYVYIYIVKIHICIFVFYSIHSLKDKIATSKQIHVLGFNGYYLISPQKYIVLEQ